MARSDFAFFHRFRVRWSETDAQGVVFNARYLDYADIAITEYWRAARVCDAVPDAAFEFHVKRATVTWFAPIKPDEMIDVMARTTAFGTTSMTQFVEIHGSGEADDLRAQVELVNVHVDLSAHRPLPIPAIVREVFEGFDAGAGALVTSHN